MRKVGLGNNSKSVSHAALKSKVVAHDGWSKVVV